MAVNPYKQLPIYGDNFVKCYLDSSRHELSPHIYAVAEAAFKDMKIFTRDQCVIISGIKKLFYFFSKSNL